MPDDYTLLTDCADHLPIAQIVDTIAFHRIIALEIEIDGHTHPAVYPADYAIPELVKETAFKGWPPDNLERFRGGLPLVDDWEAPSEDPRTSPIATIEVDNVDEFLANPRATIGNERVTLPLTSFNVKALLENGQTIVRAESGDPVFVKAPGAGGVPSGDIVVSDISDVLTERAAGARFDVSAENVRELRERGTTWLHVRENGEMHDVRIVVEPVGEVGVTATTTMERGTATTAQPMRTRPVEAPFGSGMSSIEPHLPDLEVFEPLPQFEFVVYLAYRQEWKLLGFARGDLLNCISLAPQEETTIEIQTWDRRRASQDVSEEVGWESMLEAQSTGRITRDVTNELTRNEAWKLTSAGVQVGVPEYFQVGANLGGEFGTTLNNVSRATVSRIDEATTKASAKAHGLRQTKVTESQEWGFDQKTTRKLRNQNVSRSVSYDIFEMLGAYEIQTRVVPEETCLGVLVPSPLAVRFDRYAVLAHEGVLRATLLDPRQAVGFDACRWLASREEYCAIGSEPPCRQQKPETKPETKPQTQPSGTPVVSPQDRVTTAANRVLGAGDNVAKAVGKIRDATHHIASAYDAGVRGAALEEVILEYRQWLFRTFGLEWFQPGYWGACMRFESEWQSVHTPERVEQLAKETAAAWTEAAGRIIIATALYQLALPVMGINLAAHLGLKTLWYAQYTARGFDDAGLGANVSAAGDAVTAWRKALEEPAATTTTTTTEPETSQPTPTTMTQTPEGAPASQPFADEQTARMRVAERALLTHLEQNRTHYLEAIWRAIEPTDRARILDSVYGNLGRDVEAEVLGFFGDKVAVPFRAEHYAKLRDALADAIDALDGDGGLPKKVVLPTPGVQIRARMDDCDAAEPFVLKHRELDLAEKQAEVDRAELERDRLKARLDAQPPLLEDPSGERPEIDVRLVQPTPPSP